MSLLLRDLPREKDLRKEDLRNRRHFEAELREELDDYRADCLDSGDRLWLESFERMVSE